MLPVIRSFTADDADWLTARHAELYARDEGFDETFGVLVADIIAAFLASHDPTCEAGWIAQSDAQRLGSVFCVRDGVPGCAKLRLFLIEPDARGTGLAQMMLDTCLGFARGAGYRQIRLWTHESHRAAGRLYARNGFALVGSQSKLSFGQNVVEQFWQRDL
ncbi:MAG: GNAT family N-acetyltransferase [Pseudorhodobacter sp.]|nr:GNAT family N-acetyltransferase [Pseudorhodobacter sp.]